MRSQCVANDRRAELAAEEGVNSSGRTKKTDLNFALSLGLSHVECFSIRFCRRSAWMQSESWKPRVQM